MPPTCEIIALQVQENQVIGSRPVRGQGPRQIVVGQVQLLQVGHAGQPGSNRPCQLVASQIQGQQACQGPCMPTTTTSSSRSGVPVYISLGSRRLLRDLAGLEPTMLVLQRAMLLMLAALSK